MYLSLANFRHQSFSDGRKPINFPIGSSSDYSAIKRITKSDLEKWSKTHLQLFMDYCLSKEIFEIAAMIRDMAITKGFTLHIS